MTTEQRILQIETELASLKADLPKQAPTMERQDDNHTNDSLRYHGGKKDWEILEYITTRKHNEPGVKISINNLDTGWRHHYDCAYKTGDVTIHSIRRLYDNTIWTVGQFVKPESPASKVWDRYPVHVIKYFYIGDSGQIYACCDSNIPVCGPIHSKTNAYKSGCFPISELRTALQPLFTTADGIQLYDREQDVYSLAKAGSYYTGYIFKGPAFLVADWNSAYSTLLAAEKAYNTWLAEQPVLSLKEISQFIDMDDYRLMEELVKDKIAKR